MVRENGFSAKTCVLFNDTLLIKKKYFFGVTCPVLAVFIIFIFLPSSGPSFIHLDYLGEPGDRTHVRGTWLRLSVLSVHQ
jgi:hypothetical protein